MLYNGISSRGKDSHFKEFYLKDDMELPNNNLEFQIIHVLFILIQYPTQKYSTGPTQPKYSFSFFISCFLLKEKKTQKKKEKQKFQLLPNHKPLTEF